MDHSQFARDVVAASTQLGSAPAYRSWALRRLRSAASFDSAVYVPLSHPQGGPASLNRDEPETARYHGLFVARPAYYGPSLEKGRLVADANGGVYVDTLVYSARERDALPFFADIVRPQKIRSQIVLMVSFHGRSRGSIHLCRHGSGTPFSPEDAAVLRQLVPALALAQAAFDVGVGAGRATEVAQDRLTERELTVARLVARGFHNRDIAALLGTSPNTVRNQLAVIFRKLRIRGRAELAAHVVMPTRLSRAG
jgi:DNA-binding CsgD family transcriptional regulator